MIGILMEGGTFEGGHVHVPSGPGSNENAEMDSRPYIERQEKEC